MTTPTTTARATPEIRSLLLKPVVALALAAALTFAASFLWAPARLIGVVWVVVALAYAAYVLLYLRRAFVEFGGGHYRVREAGTDVRFSAADAALVVPIDELALPSQVGPALVVIGTTRRRLVEINALSFGKGTLEALASDLLEHGVPIDHLDGRWTTGRFDARHPGVLSWTARHTVAINVLAVVVLAVASVAVVVAFA
jgi:hypothetical protein